MILFTQQLATMCKAGISLLNALGLIGDVTANKRMQAIVADIGDRIRKGESLSGACGRYPGVFSSFFLGMITSSESSGTLSDVLERIAQHLESQEKLRKKILGAMVYPVIVVLMCIGVITFLVVCIVPVFSTAYEKLGVSLPGVTVALIALSDFVRAHWWMILGGISLTWLLWASTRKTTSVRNFTGKLKLTIPIFGPLNRTIAVSRFIKNFALMIRCGITVQDSIEIARGICASPMIDKAADRISEAVNAGRPFLDPMRESGVFPTMVIGMAAAGEASGSMPEMLETSSAFLEEEIDRTIKKLLVKLEPMITVGLAAVVGFILMAVYLPMFDMMKVAR